MRAAPVHKQFVLFLLATLVCTFGGGVSILSHDAIQHSHEFETSPTSEAPKVTSDLKSHGSDSPAIEDDINKLLPHNALLLATIQSVLRRQDSIVQKLDFLTHKVESIVNYNHKILHSGRSNNSHRSSCNSRRVKNPERKQFAPQENLHNKFEEQFSDKRKNNWELFDKIPKNLRKKMTIGKIIPTNSWSTIKESYKLNTKTNNRGFDRFRRSPKQEPFDLLNTENRMNDTDAANSFNDHTEEHKAANDQPSKTNVENNQYAPKSSLDELLSLVRWLVRKSHISLDSHNSLFGNLLHFLNLRYNLLEENLLDALTERNLAMSECFNQRDNQTRLQIFQESTKNITTVILESIVNATKDIAMSISSTSSDQTDISKQCVREIAINREMLNTINENIRTLYQEMGNNCKKHTRNAVSYSSLQRPMNFMYNVNNINNVTKLDNIDIYPVDIQNISDDVLTFYQSNNSYLINKNIQSYNTITTAVQELADPNLGISNSTRITDATATATDSNQELPLQDVMDSNQQLQLQDVMDTNQQLPLQDVMDSNQQQPLQDVMEPLLDVMEHTQPTRNISDAPQIINEFLNIKNNRTILSKKNDVGIGEKLQHVLVNATAQLIQQNKSQSVDSYYVSQINLTEKEMYSENLTDELVTLLTSMKDVIINKDFQIQLVRDSSLFIIL